jgi:hypothetical protein
MHLQSVSVNFVTFYKTVYHKSAQEAQLKIVNFNWLQA